MLLLKEGIPVVIKRGINVMRFALSDL